MLAIFAGGCKPVYSQTKKLIEYGWDTPSPQELRDDLPDWQNRPFSGIIFSLDGNSGQVFNLDSYVPSKIDPQIDTLTGLHWGRFTDNFLQMTCGSNMEWTSDNDWKIVLAHVSLCARAAKAAGCVGFVFDPEPYFGIDPWEYPQQPHAGTTTFSDYEKIVRKRGREFCGALQQQLPGMKFLTLYQYSQLLNELGPIPLQADRERALSTNHYGLLPAFLDGMLEQSGSHVEFIDGNEPSYYYQYPISFSAVYPTIRQSAKIYVAPELRGRFARQERVAQAVYIDYIYNLRPDVFPHNVSIHMSATERDMWLESNLYCALNTSDEYVWLYSETVHWWPDKGVHPAGMDRAIATTEQKVEENKPLGFNISPTMDMANVQKALALLGLK